MIGVAACQGRVVLCMGLPRADRTTILPMREDAIDRRSMTRVAPAGRGSRHGSDRAAMRGKPSTRGNLRDGRLDPRPTPGRVSHARFTGHPAAPAEMFAADFLKNPHRVPMLQPRTRLDPQVARFIAKDSATGLFAQGTMSLSRRPVPCFVTTGKNCATVAIGCTGGRHTFARRVRNMAKRFRTAHLTGTEGEARGVVTVLHRELGVGRRRRIMTGAGAHP